MPLPFWLCRYSAYFLCPKVQVTICTLQWTQGSLLFYSIWKVECLEMMPSWCRQVNWGNCGITWLPAQFSVLKTTWKDSSEACATACQNCTVYSVFPSGMRSQSKIAQFNWECLGRFTHKLRQGAPTESSLWISQQFRETASTRTGIAVFRHCSILL